MTEAEERPTWEEMGAYLESAAPVLVRLRGEPTVDFFLDSLGSRFGLRVHGSTTSQDLVSDSPLVALEVSSVLLEDGPTLEIATSVHDLYPHFFAFALSVADRIQVDHLPAETALRRSLRDWRTLFEQLSLLAPERQLGLLGELWLLDRLMDIHGLKALDAWTGPRGEAHDFRIDSSEFEVKTTSGEHRIHQISSDSQLTPSPGRDLFVLSLQFAAGGPGDLSLRGAIEALRKRLTSSATIHFEEVLEDAFQLPPASLAHYSNRLTLRTRPYLVAVGKSFPRITRADVLSIAGRAMSRISDVRYRVDLDGLGWEDGTPEFLAVLPEAPT
jgi:hypothetical protein